MLIHEVNEHNYLKNRTVLSSKVNEKFLTWDRLGERKEEISKAQFNRLTANLFKDPTIWAYATLRDKQNQPMRMYYFQDMILNDQHRFIHVSAANQIGKTWAVIVKALHHALFTNNASVMLISRSEKQAKNILDEMKWMMKRAKINYNEMFKDDVDNRMEYHLPSPDGIGTSVIRVFPPTPTILGFPATLIIMDETGFWEMDSMTDSVDFYQQCIRPRTNTTKSWKHPFLTMGQIISITNPNGQNGLAWWLYNNDDYHNYKYCWLTNPTNSYEEYKKEEKTLPPIRFASVYAAEYVSATGGFITLAQYDRFKSYESKESIEPGMTLFLGGDFASEDPKSKNTDWHVLYGVVQVPNKAFPQHPRMRVVYRKVFEPGTKREEIYNELDRLKNLPEVVIAKFAYDKVGVGDSVKTDLIGRGTFYEKQIEALTYSLPSKSDVYLKFQSLFHQDMIEGWDIPELKEQLLALKVEQPTGSIHIKVHHKTEGVKDDEPDALANACFVASVPIIKHSLSFIPHNKITDRPVPTDERTCVCPRCEDEGKEPYHQAKAIKHFEKVLCRRHQSERT